VRYLCGFSGSSAALMVTMHEAVLFTDSRYTLQAGEEVEGAAVETVSGPPLKAALRAAPQGARVGFESEHLTMAQHAGLVAEAGGRLLAPLSGTVERLRAVKDAAEIDDITASIRLNSEAFLAGVEAMRDGATELDVAAAIEHRMRRLGAESPAFESIVASGPRGALPHARATRRVMRPGEPVVVDIGAMLEGYASDMTRTVFISDPGDTGRRVHGAVLEGLRRAEGVVRDGSAASDVDAVARGAVVEAGFAAEAYRHGTGHGVGLQVHESPRITAESGDRLEAGMVLTIEPGIYVPGWGGVRIEDVVLVEEGGCRVLTPTPRSVLTV